MVSLPRLNGTVAHSPSPADVPAPYRRALLWRKLRICALHFNFLKPNEESRRNTKRDALLDILEVVNTQPYASSPAFTHSTLLNDACSFQETMGGIELGLFRPQPREEDVSARVWSEV